MQRYSIVLACLNKTFLETVFFPTIQSFLSCSEWLDKSWPSKKGYFFYGQLDTGYLSEVHPLKKLTFLLHNTTVQLISLFSDRLI